MFSIKFIIYFFIIAAIFHNYHNGQCSAQSILDRFRPNSNITNPDVEQVKFVTGSKVKRMERLTVPLFGNSLNLQQHPTYYGYATYVRRQPLPSSYLVYYPYINFRNVWPNQYRTIWGAANWQAGAQLMGEGIEGRITFQQLPYNNDIKVVLNATGIPAGKHALHIHTYGDLSDGCKSTGGQFPNNFLGNVDVKDDGVVNAAFVSVYLTLFGFNGIIGRSIVLHEKPIDLNTALNAEVFSSSLHPNANAAQAYQNEETAVGEAIACGIISVLSVPIPTVN